MKEKMNMRLTPLHGKVRIQLFEEDKCVYDKSGTNVIKDIVEVNAKRMWKSLASQGLNQASPLYSRNGGVDYNMFRYLYLVNSNNVPNPLMTYAMFPTSLGEAQVVGWVDRLNTAISPLDAKIGTVASDSFVDDTGVTFIYEWGAAQAIGEFNSFVHANLSLTPITSDAYYAYYESEPVLKMDLNDTTFKTFQMPAVPYCMYMDGTDLMMATGFAIVNTNDLTIDIYNLTQGTVSLAAITVTGYGTTIPDKAVVYHDPITTDNYTWAFARSADVIKLVYSTDSNASTSILTLDSEAYDSLSIDENYVYMQSINNSNYLRRYDHTTITGLVTDYIVLASSEYAIVSRINDALVALSTNKARRWELDGLDWAAHDTIAYSITKTGFPTVNQPAGQYLGGYYYGNIACSNFSPVYAGGETTFYIFSKVNMSGGRMVESAHYKHTEAITKTGSQSLRITYRFDFVDGV